MQCPRQLRGASGCLLDTLNAEQLVGRMKTSTLSSNTKLPLKIYFPLACEEHKFHVLYQRAFEDDDCVAVVEQSPNTADTRARPPGPSLVTVHMEPALQELQQETLPASESHSVTVETYPEPILDTKVGPHRNTLNSPL